MSIVLGTTVPLHVTLNFKYLYNSLITKLNSVDKSIQADFNCIRFDFERRHVARVISIQRKLNFADPGTKYDRPLCTSLQLTLHYGRLAHSFDAAKACDADSSLGQLCASKKRREYESDATPLVRTNPAPLPVLSPALDPHQTCLQLDHLTHSATPTTSQLLTTPCTNPVHVPTIGSLPHPIAFSLTTPC